MKTMKILTIIFGLLLMAGSLRAQQHEWQTYLDTTAQPDFGGSPNFGNLITIDGSGKIWILEEVYPTYIVAEFDGQSWTHFQSSQDGLLPGEIRRIIRDHNGDIWVSGDSGIAKFSDGKWQSYSIQDTLSGKRSYGAIAADSNGNVWVATLAYRFITQFGSGSFILDSAVAEIFRFDGATWTPFPIALPANVNPSFWQGISTISVASNGIVWATGLAPLDNNHRPIQGLWKWDGQTWQGFDIEDDMDTNMTPIIPTSIHADQNGGAWVSFFNLADYSTQSGFMGELVNYFNGSSWRHSEFTGTRFGRNWLSPNGDRYFLSSPTARDTSRGGVIIASQQGIVDSIPKSTIPFYPLDLNFAGDGSVWLLSASGQGAIIEHLSSASVVVPQVNSLTLPAIAYPNPFRATTNITYSLPSSGMVTILLFNSAGVLVSRIASEHENAGEHTQGFDGSNLPNGSYRAEIQCVVPDGEITREEVNLTVMR
jgi:hypothetical protein